MSGCTAATTLPKWGIDHGWVDFCCGAREFGEVWSYERVEEACYQKEIDDKKFEFLYQKDSCVLKYLIKPLARNDLFY